tara:strand:- start:505 stop:792 length:288 start_codon:yes stop_codon:yes gene_type:complete
MIKYKFTKMDIQQAIKINRLLSDANMKLTGLIMKGVFETDDNIIFYIDTFRRNNRLIPYLTFRHNGNNKEWNKTYKKIGLYFPENISKQIYLPNN